MRGKQVVPITMVHQVRGFTINRYINRFITLYALAGFLRQHGAETVSIASLDYVFDRENPLFAKLEAFLTQVKAVDDLVKSFPRIIID